MSHHIHSYLALGDSYTIGDGVALYESFPYQLVQILREKGLHFHAPEIIAKTGWTTAELAEHLLHQRLNEKYDFVTLMIGVNNQYRGLGTQDYETDFAFLLRKAIHFAGAVNEHVFILSIPDYSRAPFTKGKDTSRIEEEINSFNACNRALSARYNVNYINVTEESRTSAPDRSLFASDGLHYSASRYKTWAGWLAESMSRVAKH